MEQHSPELQSWTETIRRRGLTGPAQLMLHILEPLGPLGAQALWVFQPLLGWFGWRQAIGELARTLEQPGGIEALRQQLMQHDPAQDE